MKIDNTSMFFNAPLAPGVPGGTAAWGTSVGQSKNDGYKIDTSKAGLVDFLIGMNYKIRTDITNLDISSGSESRELLMFSIFDKVYINNELLVNTSFILILVKEHSISHDGRIIISYPYYASYKHDTIEIKNSDAIKSIAEKLGCPEGCWFVYDISIVNQDELHFKAIVVSNSPKTYSSSQERKTNWSNLVDRECAAIIPQINFELSKFIREIKQAGLIFNDQIVHRFIASLCTKPFVICIGLSGSGKTKLAQAFAQWICYKEPEGEKNNQYCIVPVGSDWTNREPLLGYPNALEDTKYVKPENGVLDLINRARLNENKPYFLILDEMNLSHVERYFADFLSTMESGEAIPLHTIEKEDSGLPKQLNLPKNLFVIGTVNIDETTYMFSPKVLDRANTIEFTVTKGDLKDFINSNISLNTGLLKGEGSGMGESFVAKAKQKHKNDNAADQNLKNKEADLKEFFEELKKSGAEFGYRTASEIGRLMFMLELFGEKDDNLLDIAIMQKLLPKLHGSRSKLNTTLTTLAKFCVNDAINDYEGKDEDFRKTYFTAYDKLPQETLGKIKYKISFEKISRMHKNAIENGFTSYAEA